MASGVIPAVGHWYQNPDQSKFEVIALDEDEGVIEIQYFDGELDEMEFDVWPQLGLEGVSPPEDWTGAYDGFEHCIALFHEGTMNGFSVPYSRESELEKLLSWGNPMPSPCQVRGGFERNNRIVR